MGSRNAEEGKKEGGKVGSGKSECGSGKMRGKEAWKPGGYEAGNLGKQAAVYAEPFIPEFTTEGLTAEELSRGDYRIKQQNQKTGALAPFLLSILPASQPPSLPASYPPSFPASQPPSFPAS